MIHCAVSMYSIISYIVRQKDVEDISYLSHCINEWTDHCYQRISTTINDFINDNKGTYSCKELTGKLKYETTVVTSATTSELFPY